MRGVPVKVRISKTTAEAIPAGGRIVDSAIEGFLARRLPSGKIAYGFRYRVKGKPQQWVSLGVHGQVTAEQARTAAKALQGRVAERRDPAAEDRAEREAEAHALRMKRNSVNVILDRYLKERVKGEKKLRSADQIERVFERLVRPVIGTKSVYEVSRDDINAMLRTIGMTSGLVARDNALANLRAAFNWWQVQDAKFVSPIVKGMIAKASRERERVLADDEIRSLWQALDSDRVNPTFANIVRVLLYTAQRRSDVSDMTRDELDGEHWTIPAERFKNGATHHVHLSATVRGWLPAEGDGYLFSTGRGSRKAGDRPFSGFSKCKAELDGAIAQLRKDAEQKPMADWTLHDLRRTARSLMSRAGVSSDIAEMAIGHRLQGVRRIYDRHSYAAERKDALERLGSLLDLIINPPADNVVRLERPAS